MKTTSVLVLVAGSLLACPVLAQPSSTDPVPAQASQASGRLPALSSIPLRDIELSGGFWKVRQDTNRTRTVWANFEQCEKTGRLANFEEAAKFIAGDKTAQNRGLLFNDSDVYKVLEGAAYILATNPDQKLREYCDAVIKKIGAAQLPDGYINTYHTVKAPDQRWKAIEHNHELYCGGHLIEAGIAYFEATGDRTLLDIGIRFADHVDSLFGPGKRHAVPGHEEIELALIKLWRITGQDKYLKLARYFVDARGHTKGRATTGEYSQDHLPVREQDHIVGHAVRGMYLFMAVADLTAIQPDDGYIQASDDVWFDLTHRKTYITGGIGPSAHNEGFTTPYDLPNDTAYAETCAGIGSVMWNQRLGRLYADAKYFDVAERALYNGVLSGVSLSGDRFFYVNPLLSRGNHDRPEWYECACCPPNILRLIADVGTMFYSTAKGADGKTSAVYANFYNTGIARFDDAGLIVHQKTDYPWDGRVTLSISSSKAGNSGGMAVNLFARIPGWCRGASASVNGKKVELKPVNGYAKLGSSWRTGDEIVLDLPMPIERIAANPQVQADVGRIALQRGPVVYCLESADNKESVLGMALPPDSKLTSELRTDLLSGVSVINGSALAPDAQPEAWKGELYRAAPVGKPVSFTAIPYFAWNNRGRSTMTVWLPESLGLLNTKVIGPHTYTSSFRFRDEVAGNIADGSTPKNSGDYDVPRLTFWPHKGTTEWAQVEFDKPRKVSSVEVYWFDDTGRGECKIPQSWKILYKDGDAWKEVAASGAYPIEKDKFCRVEFSPVRTTGVKIEVGLQEGWSTGVIEWKLR
ncbi:MAG: glycoside hydrolase family 127 protein [Phycisphaerales bacterium]|nr:glycoside hydrolase family 127 protein [Phycisphaerales bacterium]